METRPTVVAICQRRLYFCCDFRASNAHCDRGPDMQSLSPRAARVQPYICSCCAARLKGPIGRACITGNRARNSRFGEVPRVFYTDSFISATAPHGISTSDWKKYSNRLSRAHRNAAASRRSTSTLATEYEDGFDDTVDSFPYHPIAIVRSICKPRGYLERHMESYEAHRVFMRDLHRLFMEDGDAPRSVQPDWDALDQALKYERSVDLAYYKKRALSPRYHREPEREIQFEKFEEMMIKLVEDLIKQAYFDEVPHDPDLARRNIEDLDSAWTQIRLLRSEGYPRYTFYQLDRGGSIEARHQLSENIELLFAANRDTIQIKPKFQVAKICFNLLICEFAPTIHHFNALILGFARQDMPNLVDLTAATLLETSRLRTTEQTFACLLAYYQSMGDILGFYDMIQRLVGLDPGGLIQKRRMIFPWKIIGPRMQEWMRKREIVTAPGTDLKIQLLPRTDEIYNALVLGLLAFGRTKDAVKVVLASMRDEVGIPFDTLSRVVEHCLYGFEIRTSKLLLRGLLDHADVVTRFLLDSECPARAADDLYSLWWTAQPVPENMSEEAEIARSSRWMFIPHNRDSATGRLARAIFIRQAEHQLETVSNILLFADQLVSTKSPEALFEVAEVTIQSLNDATTAHKRRAKTIARQRKLSAAVSRLEKTTWAIQPYDVKATHDRVVQTLGDSLPFFEMKPRARRHRLEELADSWLYYRIRKKQSRLSVESRLFFETELCLLYGRRLLYRGRGLVIYTHRERSARAQERRRDGDRR